MLGDRYLAEIESVIHKVRTTQGEQIDKAAALMAETIANQRPVYLFGSGHSVLPCMDIFPRYGSFVGLVPITDPRLMWCNVVGSGGARELLWLEQQEGYVQNILLSYHLTNKDTMLLYSHGGLNAAAIEMGLAARDAGASVVSVTSMANYAIKKPRHSSGKMLADVADVVIDNCVPPDDAMIPLPGRPEKVAAGSTVSVIAISMALVAATAQKLAERHAQLSVFVSPNVSGVSPKHNQEVFETHERFLKSL